MSISSIAKLHKWWFTLRTLKNWADSHPITLSCIPFQTDDVGVDVVCKKSTFYVIQQLVFKNVKSCDTTHRVVRKVMSHFGFRRRHLISHCTLCLYSMSLHLPVAILLLKILYLLWSSIQILHSLLDVQSKVFWVKQDKGAISALSCMSSHVQSHSSCSTKSQTPIGPWCTTVFQKQSLTGCRVKAMKSNPAVIGYCRRRGG